MKTIKGTYRDNNYFEYEVNGKKYWVQGELYWNKKRNRLEHTHTGPRGGKYLIYWHF
nr:MAG TPA: PBCV-specific basic adaptor domain [Caudoviricetes sp.]